jgi:hypothetical protein
MWKNCFEPSFWFVCLLHVDVLLCSVSFPSCALSHLLFNSLQILSPAYSRFQINAYSQEVKKARESSSAIAEATQANVATTTAATQRPPEDKENKDDKQKKDKTEKQCRCLPWM